MLRMCEKILRYGISNQTTCDTTGVKRVHEREHTLKWFGHVERMDDERTPVKAKHFEVDCLKKGTPKKSWKEVVEKDMLVTGLRTDGQGRSFWRLDCKNRLTQLRGKTSRVTKR